MKMRLSDSIKKWAIAAAAAALLVWCAADIDWSTLNYFSWGTFRATIANLCKPDFAAFYTGSSEDIFHLMLLTVGIGFFGTTIGTVLAVPFTLLASRSLWKNPVVPRVGKFVLDVLRAFPELVYAIIFIKVVGPGAFAGVLAIGVHQIGMLGKLFTEEMERMDETPVEACHAVGANGVQTMFYARLPQLMEVARKFGLKIVSIASLIAYRLREESIVEKGVTVPLPTEWGDFRITPFRQKSNGVEHVALTKGEWTEDEPVLIRVHSSCATGDIFGSYRCDCGEQLHRAMQMIQKEGKGAIVYLNQEGRGIGLCNKIHAYKLQDEGLDTVDANLRLGFKADERDYGVGASIIRELGIRHMRLMTNNPLKRAGLEGYGLKIDEIVPIVIAPNKYNEHYLETKQERMHHTLGLEKK